MRDFGTMNAYKARYAAANHDRDGRLPVEPAGVLQK
jgi:hypothetical protein